MISEMIPQVATVQIGVLRHGTTDSCDDAGLYHSDSHRLQLRELFIKPRDHNTDVVQTITLLFHNLGI